MDEYPPRKPAQIARLEAAWERRHRLLRRKRAGEPIAAIAKDEGISRARVQQLTDKAEEETMATALIADKPDVPSWEINIHDYIEIMGYLRRSCAYAMSEMAFTDRDGQPFPHGFSTNSWQHADAASATRLAESIAVQLRTERCGFFPHRTSREAKILWDKLRTLQQFLSECGGFSVA